MNKRKKGFTLSEMLVVIAIIAVIAVIAVPSIIVVNNNINKRLLNQKIEHIITAAELYGTDNPDIFNGRSEVKVYVSELIDTNYIEKEVNINESEACTGDATNNSTVGCIINPTDKTSMNKNHVILKREAIGIVASYNGTSSSGDDDTLVNIVCQRLKNGKSNAEGEKFTGKDANGSACDCTDIENGSINACIVAGGNDTNNYLKYDNVMWRVMGIYNIYDDTTRLSAKMINDDNVEIVIE